MSEASSSSSFYKVGGALPQQIPSYVTRKSDLELYKALKAQEFCYVLNSRQMGKTSLMVRTLAQLRADGWLGVSIDFSAKDSQIDKPDRWYDGIINQLNRQLNLLEHSVLRNWIKDRNFISPVERLEEFIEVVLLPNIPSPLVVFIDEIDSTLRLPFTDDFFALIRACYNKRAENSAYQKLSFILLGVAAPSELISDANRTPFNIGKSIDLRGFELEEASPLAAGLMSRVDYPQVVLKEILKWTGGQPFLTQRLCQLVIDSQVSISEGNEAASIEKLVYSHIIKSGEFQDHQEHLKTIRTRILENEQKAGYLLELYRQVLTNKQITSHNLSEEKELQLSGLVIKRDGYLTVYNPIYETVFDESWIDVELKKLRPYSEAFRAWAISGKKDASRLIRGEALLEAQKWAAGKKTISAEDHEFLGASHAQKREERIAKQEQDLIQERLVFQDKENKKRLLRKKTVFTKTIALAIPVLLIGQLVVLRKARFGLLQTAHQNLTSSAILKAEDLAAGIKSASVNLDLLGETEAFQQVDPAKIETLLKQFSEDTPYEVTCVELIAPQADTAAVNTCDRNIVPSNKQVPWLQTGSLEKASFYVFSPDPSPLDESVADAIAVPKKDRATIQFIVAKPIYDDAQNVRYTIAMEVSLSQLQDPVEQSLVGETVVIDPNNVIVTHPDGRQVGRHISELRDSTRLLSTVGNVEAGNSDFIHLFRFLPQDNQEWIAGYSGFSVTLNPKKNNVWTVLAVTHIEDALGGLNEIIQILLSLNLGLIGGVVTFAKYISLSIE